MSATAARRSPDDTWVRFDDAGEHLKLDGKRILAQDKQSDEAAQREFEATAAGAPAVEATAPAATDRMARLERLADLRDRGILTDAEFAAEKTKILGSG